jgi:hypothetical protein
MQQELEAEAEMVVYWLGAGEFLFTDLQHYFRYCITIQSYNKLLK